MSLMISVSGIRGIVGKSLTPEQLTMFTMAYASWIRHHSAKAKPTVVIGRDTRPTGTVIGNLVAQVLALSGCNVINIGMATTPTVEIAVPHLRADGGLIITASHNPVEWNALKMLDNQGEFLNDAAVTELLDIADSKRFVSAAWNEIGTITEKGGLDSVHIEQVITLPCIDRAAISCQRYRVLVDCVEGAGSVIVPYLCRKLGIAEVVEHACKGTGLFPRNPEPIERNLTQTVAALQASNCDFALVVDPDVDRLALLCEDGTLFGEEYTLVACADYYLATHSGPVVNNLSSSRALRDIADRHHVDCYSAKVGEANVSAMMKECGAVIGGEGNGGVILPELHYGRDALVAIALIVQAFTAWRSRNKNGTLSQFRQHFPSYAMSKMQMETGESTRGSLEGLFDSIAASFPAATPNRLDGLKLDFADKWVHLRPSNTEPIIRIYAEARTRGRAENLAQKLKVEIEHRVANSIGE